MQGAIRAHIYDPYVKVVEQLPFIFFEMDGIPVPWKIISYETSPVPCIKVATFGDPESAAALTGKPMFMAREDLPLGFLPPEEGDERAFAFLAGFEAFASDDKKEYIGKITRVDMYPNQEMAIVRRDGDKSDQLIPLVAAYIVKIDQQKGDVYFDLPEGFLDL